MFRPPKIWVSVQKIKPSCRTLQGKPTSTIISENRARFNQFSYCDIERVWQNKECLDFCNKFWYTGKCVFNISSRVLLKLNQKSSLRHLTVSVNQIKKYIQIFFTGGRKASTGWVDKQVACPGRRLAWLIIRHKFNWQLPIKNGRLI